VVAQKPPAEEDTTQRHTPEQKLTLATDLLVRGRRFARVAELAQEVVQEQPKNTQAYSLLACACVSRAVSLVYTFGYDSALKEAQEYYPKQVQEWEEAQKDPDSDDYGTPRPQPPPSIILKTKDDDQPFRLNKDELRGEVQRWVDSAVQAWDNATKVANTPEARAEVAYLRGWGIRLLAPNSTLSELLTFDRTEDESEEAEDEPPLYESPEISEAAKAFQTATELCPANPLYWQAWGDIWDGVEGDAKVKASKAECYQKALQLKPRQPLLWYELYNLEVQKGFPPGIYGTFTQSLYAVEDDSADKTKEEKKRTYASITTALHYLRMAGRYDPANASYPYEEAGLLFRQTEYSGLLLLSGELTKPPSPEDPDDLQRRKRGVLQQLTVGAGQKKAIEYGQQAVSAIERGNQALTFSEPVYNPSVPSWLRAVWNYTAWVQAVYPMYARHRELARAAAGFALYTGVERRDLATAERTHQAIVGMGMRLIGNWKAYEEKGEPTLIRTLVGIAIVSIALKNRQQVATALGNPELHASVTQDYNNFQETAKAYKKRLNEEWFPKTYSFEYMLSHYY
jgi:hypothetical protein